MNLKPAIPGWIKLPKSLGHPDSGFFGMRPKRNPAYYSYLCGSHRTPRLVALYPNAAPSSSSSPFPLYNIRTTGYATHWLYIYYTRRLVREEMCVYNTTVSLSVVLGGGPGSARAGTVSLRSGNGSPPVTFLVWPSRLRRQWPRGGRGKFPGQLILPPSSPRRSRDYTSCREAAVI